MKLCIDKQCRRSGEKLDLSEFNKNVRIADGRGYYCRECVQRQGEVYREKRRAKAAVVDRKTKALSPLVRVKAAIDSGHRTRKEIKAATRLGIHEVCDALAELWDSQSVKIVKLGSEKVFVPRAA